MTHTPGPWTVQSLETAHNDYCDWPTFAVRSAKTNVCLATVGKVDHYESERNEANARLIAAAPDMLEALQALFENCAMTHKHWGEGSNSKEADAAIANARAAIAAALGKENQ